MSDAGRGLRLDTANRAFLTLLALSAAASAVLGLAVFVLLGLAAFQAATDPSSLGTWRTRDAWPVAAFLGPVAVGAVVGCRSVRRQLQATRALRARVADLRVVAPPEVVFAAARTAMSRRRIDVVSAQEPFSFAYGLVRPRIVLSTALVDGVAEAELDAVIEHERYHVRNLDPLKVLLARVLPSALFFLPALRDLRRRYAAGRELAADRRALDRHGRPALAGALLKVVRGPGWSELGAAAAIGADLLDVRVTQLETGREPAVPGVSRTAMLISAVVVGALVVSFSAALGDLGGRMGAVAWDAARPLVHPMSVVPARARFAFWAVIGVLAWRRVRSRRA